MMQPAPWWDGGGRQRRQSDCDLRLQGQAQPEMWWLFSENPDIHNLGNYQPGREEKTMHSLKAAGEE